MGRDLFAASAAARRTFEEADEILGFALSRLCHEGPEDALTATSHAQPAILVHSIAVLRTIEERSAGVAYAAGHSLGEFTAYVAAGALPFADAVRTVRRRGELMQQSGAARPGTMAAILGLEESAAVEVCARASTAGGVCVPANYNAPGQIVISGDVRAVEAALVLAKEAGARRAVRLNVSGAFHSPLMEEAESGLAAQLETVDLSDPSYPVVSNVTAQPVTSAADASRLLVRQLTSPVRWTDSVRTMLGLGVTTFLEIGPGSVLTGLLRRIDREARARTVGTAEEVAAFAV
jgi:[acyl-carrier-protein] S-malonyltransferase